MAVGSPMSIAMLAAPAYARAAVLSSANGAWRRASLSASHVRDTSAAWKCEDAMVMSACVMAVGSPSAFSRASRPTARPTSTRRSVEAEVSSNARLRPRGTVANARSISARWSPMRPAVYSASLANSARSVNASWFVALNRMASSARLAAICVAPRRNAARAAFSSSWAVGSSGASVHFARCPARSSAVAAVSASRACSARTADGATAARAPSASSGCAKRTTPSATSTTPPSIAGPSSAHASPSVAADTTSSVGRARYAQTASACRVSLRQPAEPAVDQARRG